LRDLSQVEEAFHKFENIRRERVEKVVAYSRKIGQTKTVSNPVALWFRDLMMPVFLKLFANSESHAWLFAHREDWDQKVG